MGPERDPRVPFEGRDIVDTDPARVVVEPMAVQPIVQNGRDARAMGPREVAECLMGEADRDPHGESKTLPESSGQVEQHRRDPAVHVRTARTRAEVSMEGEVIEGGREKGFAGGPTGREDGKHVAGVQSLKGGGLPRHGVVSVGGPCDQSLLTRDLPGRHDVDRSGGTPVARDESEMSASDEDDVVRGGPERMDDLASPQWDDVRLADVSVELPVSAWDDAERHVRLSKAWNSGTVGVFL